MEEYGKNFKEIRKLNKKTLIQVEQATGISNENLSRWENGKSLPNIDFCVKLADFYGISLDELVGRDFTPRSRARAKNENHINISINQR